MKRDRPRIGIYQGAIIWHVDEIGVFHWGSPPAREEAQQLEQAWRDHARDQKQFRETRMSRTPTKLVPSR